MLLAVIHNNYCLEVDAIELNDLLAVRQIDFFDIVETLTWAQQSLRSICAWKKFTNIASQNTFEFR